MRSKAKITTALLCVMLVTLSGCSGNDEKKADKEKTSEETTAINEGEYSALLPFKPSDAGQKHTQMAQLYGNQTDTLAIGTGLMELSKQHFSPKTYAFRGGVYLDYDTLDSTQGSAGLLGRTSASNAIGLNPPIGDSFPTDKGDVKITKNDVLLFDIFEYDWYRSKELKGLSLALVLNDKLGSDEKQATIKEDKLKAYGEETAIKVVNFLRKSKPEIGDDTPIYVTLFNASKADETLPGTFIEDAFFESKTNAVFHAIEEQWVLFPTTKATKLDGTNATYFDRYKASFKEFLTQDVDMIGKGHFKNKELTSLAIDVTIHAKSADEVLAGIQLLNERLSIFASNNFKIIVTVKSDNMIVATITRNKGASKTVAQTLLT